VNKAELIEKVKEAGSLSRRQAEAAVDHALDSVVEAIKSGERVSLFGFGTFTPSSRAARTGRNPRTGEQVRIPASTGVRFAPSAAFNAALNPKPAGKKASAAKKGAKAAPAKKAAKAAKAAPAKKAGAAKKASAKKASAKKASAKKAAKSTKKR
jgi:DNA-binding protein HU-beta